MNTGKTLFAQLMDFLPWTTFSRYVQRYGGDCGVRTGSRRGAFEEVEVAALVRLRLVAREDGAVAAFAGLWGSSAICRACATTQHQ